MLAPINPPSLPHYRQREKLDLFKEKAQEMKQGNLNKKARDLLAKDRETLNKAQGDFTLDRQAWHIKKNKEEKKLVDFKVSS